MVSGEYSLVAVCRLLLAVASLVTEHRMWGVCNSLVVARGFRCPAACGIFPDQGLNPCPLRWQEDFQPLDHQGSLRCFIFNKFII